MSKWFKENGLTVLEYVRKWLLIPAVGLCLLCGRLYLSNNYVNKEYFDKAMATLREEKQRYAAEQKEELRTINGKLDTLLQNSAANGQRFTDSERRISRLEDKSDRAH